MARTVRQFLFLLRALSEAGIWIPLRKWRQFYLIAHTRWRRNQYLPRFARGQDYNDMIAFAALFQLTEDMSKYTDKILVREYITECIGKKYLSEIIQITSDPKTLNFDDAMGNFIKTNHSSGHVWKFTNHSNQKSISAAVQSALDQPYGLEKGERLYQYIVPKVLVEKAVTPKYGESLDEFGFHYGNLLWIFVGTEKDGEKKIWHCFDHERKPLYSCLDNDHKMSKPMHKTMGRFIDDESLNEMIELGSKCTQPFHFCRFDSYFSSDGIIFSELTFMPQSANWIRHAPEGKAALERFPEFFRKDKIRPLEK